MDQNATECDYHLLVEDTMDNMNSSLRMNSTPPQEDASRSASFEREVSGDVAPELSVTASDVALLEDISEVLEAIMHENGEQSQL